MPRAQSYPALELTRGSALRNTSTLSWTFLSPAKALELRNVLLIFMESPSCYSLVLMVRLRSNDPCGFY